MIKVTHVVEWTGSRGGGLTTSVLPLSNELNKVEVGSIVIGGKLPSDIVNNMQDVHSFNVIDGGFFGYSPKMKQYLFNSSEDVIHIHGLWKYSSFIAYIKAKRKKIPYVISIHGMLSDYALKRSSWRKKLFLFFYVKRLLLDAKAIHVLNNQEALNLRKFNIPISSIRVIPNGVKLPNKDSCNSINIINDNKILLYLGRIHPIKGIDNLLNAWSMMNNSHHWILVIVGWGDDRYTSVIKNKIIKSSASDTIKYLGPMFDKDKDSMLCRSDAFILPSLSEGLPISVLEAWSYSLPVLMTVESNLSIGFDTGAAKKISTQPDIMACQINEFFEFSEKKQIDIGIKGRQLVESSYGWKNITVQMRRLYYDIL
jgi:glycosyltransferase involved in cell wall biosynthesis